MNTTMNLIVIAIASVLCVISSGSEALTSRVCPSSQYFNKALVACLDCSRCPINQIIRKPCLRYRDTVCGPFKEFNKFLQISEDASISAEYLNGRKHTSHGKGRTHHKHHRGKTTEAGRSISAPKMSEMSRVTDVGMTSVDAQWRTLALGLIGILCLVSVCLLVFVFSVCCLGIKRREEVKLSYNSGVLRQEDTYVQIDPFLPEEYATSKNRSPTERGKICFYSGSHQEKASCPSTNQNVQHISPLVLGPFLLDDSENEYDTEREFEDPELDRLNMNCPSQENQGTIY